MSKRRRREKVAKRSKRQKHLTKSIDMYNNAEDYVCADSDFDAFKTQQQLPLAHFYVKGMYQRPTVLLMRNTPDSNGGKLSKQRLLNDGQAAQPYVTEEPGTGFNPQEIFLTRDGMKKMSKSLTGKQTGPGREAAVQDIQENIKHLIKSIPEDLNQQRLHISILSAETWARALYNGQIPGVIRFNCKESDLEDSGFFFEREIAQPGGAQTFERVLTQNLVSLIPSREWFAARAGCNYPSRGFGSLAGGGAGAGAAVAVPEGDAGALSQHLASQSSLRSYTANCLYAGKLGFPTPMVSLVVGFVIKILEQLFATQVDLEEKITAGEWKDFVDGSNLVRRVCQKVAPSPHNDHAARRQEFKRQMKKLKLIRNSLEDSSDDDHHKYYSMMLTRWRDYHAVEEAFSKWEEKETTRGDHPAVLFLFDVMDYQLLVDHHEANPPVYEFSAFSN